MILIFLLVPPTCKKFKCGGRITFCPPPTFKTVAPPLSLRSTIEYGLRFTLLITRRALQTRLMLTKMLIRLQHTICRDALHSVRMFPSWFRDWCFRVHHRHIYSPQNKHKHTKNSRGRLPERHKHPSTLADWIEWCAKYILISLLNKLVDFKHLNFRVQ